MVAQLLNTLLPVVNWSSLCNRSGRAIGSKGGVAPPSAQRSRTSPTRGMRLQRLLGTGFGNPVPVGLANRRAFRQCVFAVGGLPEASLREGARGRSPQLAIAPAVFTFSSDGRRIAYVLEGIGTKTWNIKMSRFARTNHTATTWFTYTRSPPSTGVLPHATHHTDCPQQDRRPRPHRR